MLSFLSWYVTVMFAHTCEGQVPALGLRTERVDFLLFTHHGEVGFGEVGLREGNEFCKLSERREKVG